MTKLLVVLALLVPSVAAADWSISPPKGWKRVTAAAEKAQVATARKNTGEQVKVEIRQWQGTLGDVERQFTGMLMVMPAGVNDESVQALADGMATATAEGLAKHGFDVTPTPTPTVKRQGTSGRILVGRDLRVHVQTRVARSAKGEVHLLLVQCGEPTAQSTCKQAMSTIKLSVK